MYQYGAWTQLQPQRPQLPQGWEAKWDPGSKKWFYINHATKTTQWEPPVPTAAQYRAPTPTNITQTNTTSFIDNHSKNAEIIISEYDGVNKEYAESLLRVYQNNITSVRKTLDDKGYRKKRATTTTQQYNAIVPKQHFVTSLKNQFPTASEDIIKEVLVSSNNSFQGARLSLESMGYEKRSASPAKKATFTTKASKPASRSTTPKSATPTSSGPAKLTDQAKKRRYEELQRKFPNLSKSLIEMALNGTNYDIELSSAVLKSSIDSVKSKQTTTAVPSSSTTTTTYTPSTSDTSYTPSTSLTPVVFGEEENDREKEKKTSPVKTTTTTSSTFLKTTSSSSNYSETAKYEHKRDYLPAKRVPIIKKTQYVEDYVSPNRITPAGPNPALVNGPNYSLLQSTRIKPSGPIASNRCGPQMANKCGPQASNAKGRAFINVGPVHCGVLHTAI